MSQPLPPRRVGLLGLALFAAAPGLAAQGTSPWTIAHELVGREPDSRFGMFLDGAGDVNGDGVPDVLVGAWNSSPGGLLTAGAAYVHSGADGSELLAWTGGAANDQMGRAVCRVDDVDLDGHADVAVGSWGHDSGGMNNNGKVTIYSGATGAVIHDIVSDMPEARFGRYMRNAGDVDADGVKDIVIGAYGVTVNGMVEAGSAWVVSGATGLPIHKFWGEAADDGFGRSVNGAGDVDGDGFDDVLVGAWHADHGGLDSGSVYLFSGQTGLLMHRFDGLAPDDALGRSVAGVGDATGDGVPDLLLAAYQADPVGEFSAGEVYLHSGADFSLVYTLAGEARFDTFGWFVEGPGDVTGDGLADLLVGGYQTDPGGRDRAGTVYLHSGADGSLVDRFDGGADASEMGRSCSWLEDLDGDGRHELLLGADTTNRDGMIAAGSVYVVASNLGPDGDGDGISDAVEVLRGTDPLDDDSDDDGFADGAENRPDTTSPLAFDSDEDGLGDGLESGLVSGVAGTDPLVFVPDADPLSTTDPLLPDTDGGQFRDGFEDLDGNGRFDPGETDPNDPSDDVFPIEILNLTPGSTAVTHTWEGRPGAMVHVAYSEHGSGPTYAAQAGLYLQLSGPVVVALRKQVDPTGQMWALAPVPSFMPHGKTFWFQAVEELNGTYRASIPLELVSN